MTERLEIKAQLSTDDTGELTGIAWPFGNTGPRRRHHRAQGLHRLRPVADALRP